MKEAVTPIREAFTKGLRDQFDPQHNADRLSYARNLRPYSGGSRLQQIPEPIVNGVYTRDWPFPQLYLTSVGFFLCSRASLSHFSSIFEPYSTLAITGGGDWSVADFGKYAFLCNGVARAYIDPATGYLALHTGNTVPVASACCDFNRGQLILGGIQQEWYDCGENHVVWSGVGKVNCTPGNNTEAGYMPMDFDGPIFCVKQLGQHVMVYGEQGICAMTPTIQPTATWGLRTFDVYGVPSRTAVTGDKKNHDFIDTAGDLWRLTANMELIRLGGKDFIAQISQQLVVTYHPRRDEVYVSGDEFHYVRTKDGWGGPNYIPMSGAAYFKPKERRLGGLAIVPVKAVPDGLSEMHLITDIINFERAAIKELQWIEVQCTIAGQEASAAVDYKYSTEDTWSTSGWYALNKEGVAHIPVAGTEFRIHVRVYTPTLFKVDAVKLRWKGGDNRFSRGLEVPMKGGSGE